MRLRTWIATGAIVFALQARVASQESGLLQALSAAQEKIEIARIGNYRTGDRKTSTSGLEPLLGTLADLATQLERAGRHDKAAECYVAIGDLLQLQGRGPEALQALGIAIQKAEAAQAADALLEALYLDGTTRFLTQDDRIVSTKRVERVLELTQHRKTAKWRAYALSLRAEIEKAANRLDDARNTIKESLDLGVTEPRFLFFAWWDLYCICFARVGQIELRSFTQDNKIWAAEAAKGLQQAARIAKEQGWEYLAAVMRPLEGNIRPYLAFLIESSAKAQELEAIATSFQSPRKPADVDVSERFVSATESTFGKDETALVMEQAAQNPEDRRYVFTAASVAAVNNEHEKALGLYEKALSLLEFDYLRLADDPSRTALHSTTTSYYYAPMLLSLQLRDYPRAFSFMERARASVLNDIIMTRTRIELSDPEQRGLYRSLQEIREALVAIPPSHPDSGRLEKEYGDLLARVRQEHPDLLTLVASPSVALTAVEEAARRSAIDILEYVCTDSQLIVFHIGPSGTHVRSVTAFRKNLTETVAALRRSLSDGRVAFDETASRELYLFLVQPIREFLTTKHLVVIPHDALYAVPFSVLRDWPEGRFLADSFAISYAPSATILLQRPPVGSLAGASALVLSGPDVKEAPLEASAVAANFVKPLVLLPEQSTPAALKNFGSGYEVIHILAHGMFDPREPMRSAVQLRKTAGDDGVLTAAEMYALPLRNAKLVTLAACESGVVEGIEAGEMLGVPRALLYAGARSVLLSRWRVDSLATFEFMRAFYAAAREVDVPEAVRRAALQVRANPGHSHPYYWAAFDLVGR